MTPTEIDRLIHRFVGGDATGIAAGAEHTEEPALLVAAVLLDPARPGLLIRAAAAAKTTRDRQLVAIAGAHLAGDVDRVHTLAREHLADHPDNVLVAWIAGGARTPAKEI
jgi:hypothetical protein